MRQVAALYPEPCILAIGSYEDTAVASPHALGYRVDEIDPQLNGLDLEAFYCKSTAGNAYDVVICISVLEHVENDEIFVRQAADLLAPGGTAVFTVDYSRRCPVTQQRPNADYRLYTTEDLRDRLMGVIPDCMLVDVPSWDEGVEDFEYEGVLYAFAGWVFRRAELTVTRYAAAETARLGGPPWKILLGNLAAQLTTGEVALAEARHLADNLAAYNKELIRELELARSMQYRDLVAGYACHM